jgi:molecular chaperone DnaK
VREVLEADDPAAIRERTEALNQAFHRVSEAIYERAAADNAAANGSANGDGEASSSDEDVVDAEVVDEPSQS